MSDDLDITVFKQMVEDHGLDFSNDADYAHWNEAAKEYSGDNMTRDIEQILSAAANKKKLASAGSLDDYFQEFRTQERAKANKSAPKPQPKSNKSATQMLDDHFADWRKKQGI